METIAYPELALHPRPLAGVTYPHPSLENTYEPGTTEPWVAQIVSGLLTATGGSTVLETGGFKGTTSAWLALTLESMGGGQLIVAEIDTERAGGISERLSSLPVPNVQVNVVCADVTQVIASLPDRSLDFVWLDDDHQHFHVASEINLLWNKMRPGGLIVGHDVYGSCDLGRLFKKFGGIALDLPRLGPAGGIGILQVPT